MEDRTQLTVNGQELQQSDVNNLGKVSALADDRVLAEILRMAPYNGTVARAVVPYGYKGNPSLLHGLVRPAGNSGAVCVNAFRAVVGSRANIATIGVKDNWRDIRTAIFTNATGTASDPTVPLGANSSGSPRWDLIYAVVTVDANGPSVTRYVKNPTSLATSPQSLVSTLITTVTLAVQPGITGATPVRPTAPADTSTSWNIPLAYVRVPNGFNGTSAVLPVDINIIATPATPAGSSGAASCRVATSNYQPAQMVTTYQNAWGAGTYRNPTYLPSDMVGATELIVLINQVSHTNGSLVDDSIDWSRRFFKWSANMGINATGFFDFDSTTSTSNNAPSLDKVLNASGISASFADSHNTGQSRVVSLSTPGTFPINYLGGIPGTANFGLYVDRSTGNLRYYRDASMDGFLTIWLTASGQYSNAGA